MLVKYERWEKQGRYEKQERQLWGAERALMADTSLEGISIEGMTATHASSACGGRGLLLLCHITLLTVVQPDEAHPSDKAMLRLRYRGDRLSIL